MNGAIQLGQVSTDTKTDREKPPIKNPGLAGTFQKRGKNKSEGKSKSYVGQGLFLPLLLPSQLTQAGFDPNQQIIGKQRFGEIIALHQIDT